MFPLIARFALLFVGRKAFQRVAGHPRLAPVLTTRGGRLALLLTGFALRWHPRTRAASHALRQARRWSRPA